MGQIRTPVCELMEAELSAVFPHAAEVEVCQDTYTQDYIVWITLDGEVRPIRITLDEYTEDDWKANIRLLLSQ